MITTRKNTYHISTQNRFDEQFFDDVIRSLGMQMQGDVEILGGRGLAIRSSPVSYTHLTLPTKA